MGLATTKVGYKASGPSQRPDPLAPCLLYTSHGDAQRDTAGIGQRDEAKRGVRARDEQVNAATVSYTHLIS